MINLSDQNNSIWGINCCITKVTFTTANTFFEESSNPIVVKLQNLVVSKFTLIKFKKNCRDVRTKIEVFSDELE